MANLTEDQQRAFGDRVTELLGDPGTATALQNAGSGLDPTKRLAKLTGKKEAAAKAEATQTKKKAELTDASKASQDATADYYKEASSAVEALIGELGEEHSLARQIRGLRSSMSSPASRGSTAPATPPAAPGTPTP